MNTQSSSSNYSMRHRVPTVFLTELLICISGRTTFVRMLAQEYLEGQSCKKKEFRK